ncbi:hypothetical protein IFM89_030724 [Coptis chinensis]|uniref:ELYS-like domain-containing protein n=1 Tax=Coptis chinensis TaxID=261450 RepID=A0A835IXT0_9MAGN|nr:hypothetical protein IFM89_030724 [Coptis chinensis]
MAVTTQNGKILFGFAYQSTSSLGPKKEALEHLASIDLIELSNEAKIERCRAIRDVRSCGRFVHYVLTSCGHASLCAECSQRCDLCPICRTPMPQNGSRIRLRLYYECVEAGLISKVYDDIFQEKEDGENQQAADVQRLYSLFDVAMENNLVSLICHYITDVCMDESAVSSDPVIAFLLDEVVVKDWCKRAFGSVVVDLRQICILQTFRMKMRISSLFKLSAQLHGISNVLEVLESSIKGTHSAQYELHCLQENVLKAKQHLEVMTWCIRHQFVENIRSRYPNYEAWHSHFHERKSAATMRSWPELITSISSKSAEQSGATLFIEDALSNLQIEKENEQDTEVTSLLKDGGASSFLKSKPGCYPFENIRSAADILFLSGTSDMVVAKQAIFLYYLFDRHWSMPDAEWRYIIDEFATSFSINRHSLLESQIFYLLDDHTEQALQEACALLPEIAGPATHPKIAQVLLERQNQDAALMVLRWSGLDGLCAYANRENGRTELVSLREALTAVRVRVECGLLTEAFMYQRTHHLKAKEENSKRGSSQVVSNDLRGEHPSWEDRMETLVTEICCLCIRRNLVDRMIELPWSSDEEKFVHKCLFDYATEDPSTNFGSLLVVFYLQRFRYIEAYQVDRKLQSLEQDCISRSSISHEVESRIRTASQHRVALVDRCIELLPISQQQQVKSGDFDSGFLPCTGAESVSKSNLNEANLPKSTSSLPSLFSDSPLINSTILIRKAPASETPHRHSGHMMNPYSESSNFSSSILLGKFPKIVRGTSTPQKSNFASDQLGIKDDFVVDDVLTPGIRLVNPQSSKPPKVSNRSSSKVIDNNNLQNGKLDKVLPGRNSYLFANQPENIVQSYPSKTPMDQISTPRNDPRLARSIQDLEPAVSGKRVTSDGPWMEIPANESMDYSWSYGNGDPTVKDMKRNGGLRWRSDETSEDEEEQNPERIFGGASSLTPTVRTRRRVSRR